MIQSMRFSNPLIAAGFIAIGVVSGITVDRYWLGEGDTHTALLEGETTLEHARKHLDPGSLSGDRDLWLDLLMSHLIEPQLAALGMCFVYDYPASQAALSCLSRVDDVVVGQRFELYVDGMELANGYFELTDADEQRRRFEQDNLRRREYGQSERPLDELLLAAMSHGLPSCSGVALGVDRLLMLVTGVTDIREVLAFDWERS